MARLLSELLAEAKGGPIDWEGQSVIGSYVIDELKAGSSVHIRFIQSSSRTRQALRIRTKDGALAVADDVLEDIVLWTNTAPESVYLECQLEGRARSMSVRLWNAWWQPAPGGFINAWHGNSGIIAEPMDLGVTRLRCSDGVGDPEFSDLVVDISVNRGLNTQR